METTANLHPKEGVFWILTKDENLIKQGKFQLLFDFCGYESHDTVWKKQQKAHSELLGFDYEFFRAEEYGKIMLIRKRLIQFSLLAY